MTIEILFLLLLGYLILGPKKSAHLARRAGEFMSQFRDARTSFQRKIEEELQVQKKE